jgi:glucose-1-phosphate cytidylyltransferase
MKVVILAGGLGSRISEETKLKPKPMVEIGGKPIIWHIMKIYSFYGINDFIICCGYKGEKIKKYFAENNENWNVSCIDTGLETMTGGRLKRIQNLIDDTFCLTYGDTVNDLNIEELIKFHKKESRLATVTSCIPPEKYGVLEIKENKVISFKEKPPMEEVWVNGGFFVLEPQIFEYLENDSTIWEKEPMEGLVKNNQLSAYKHSGFYQHMDTIKEKNFLNKLWQEEKAKWKVW